MEKVGLSPRIGRKASSKTWNWAPDAVALV